MIMSRIQLGPYVNFQGRAREAMEFRHKVLGSNLDLQTLNGKGSADWSGCGQLLIDQSVKALAEASRLSNGNSKPISVSA
jgi:uncharacterized glyoxalase superfamily protein PhnB